MLGRLIGFSQWEYNAGTGAANMVIRFTKGKETDRGLTRSFYHKINKEISVSTNQQATIKIFCSAKNPLLEFIYD